MDKAIHEKLARFKIYSALKKGDITAEAKEAKKESEAEKEEFNTVSPYGDGISVSPNR